MAIHDVDKGGMERDNPRPNTHDNQQIRWTAHGTTSVNYTTNLTDSVSNDPIKSGIYRVVLSGTITVLNDGSNTTVTKSYHGLGYVPFAQATINNAIPFGGNQGPVSVFLPTWLSVDMSGSSILIDSYMSYWTDSSYVYIVTLNKVGTAISVPVTVYLFQQATE